MTLPSAHVNMLLYMFSSLVINLLMNNPPSFALFSMFMMWKSFTACEYKINTQKSLAFLYTNNAKQKEVKGIIPLTTETKRIKYLGINLPKEIKGLYIEN